MGLVLGFFKKIKEKDGSETAQNENYTADRFSSTMALLGTLFTWIFFPTLAADYVDQ